MVLMGLLLSGCLGQTLPIEPEEPKIEMPFLWIRGQPTTAMLSWPNFGECGDDDWSGCKEPDTPMTVQHVTCDGCDIIDDPTGKTSQEPIALVALATTDDKITVTVDMRFDATGARRQVVAIAMGDHEVALEAQCRLVDTATLANQGSWVPASLVHDCTTTRLPTETVLVFPSIRTYHGNELFPFCVGQFNLCRADAALSMTPAPTQWGFSDTLQNYGFSSAYFGALPPPGSAQTVSLSAHLLDGTTSSTSLAIPPLAPSGS